MKSRITLPFRLFGPVSREEAVHVVDDALEDDSLRETLERFAENGNKTPVELAYEIQVILEDHWERRYRAETECMELRDGKL